jgi:PhzF family phenazine biosynthesis protein
LCKRHIKIIKQTRMRLFTVDAFTNSPFSGNPAGVCILDNKIPEELYQLIAREINLSETAFIMAVGSKYEIRWFTPTVEVNLCGHATLAAALTPYWGKKLNKKKMIGFQASERTGIIECELADDNRVLLRGNALIMSELIPNWVNYYSM